MAASEKKRDGSHNGEVLKPFYQRASEAEDRLSRLEAALGSKKDAGNEELWRKITELESKLEDAYAVVASEREKAEKLVVENAKLQYRVTHLVRAMRECDTKLESITGGLESSTHTISKLGVLQL